MVELNIAVNIDMNYLYQITNIINQKIYIGVHKTEDIDDGYMGSGKLINAAIKKYGIENFKKDILEFFDTYELALAKEAEIVTDEFLLREDVYNLRRGGMGGFDYINQQGLNDRTGMIHSEESKKRMGRSPTAEVRLATSIRFKNKIMNPNILKTGSDHPASCAKTEIHKSKISAAIEEKHKDGIYKNSLLNRTGPEHPCYGTCWITKDTKNKKIKKADLDIYISDGWRTGRKM